MAIKTNISDDKSKKVFVDILRKGLQSANINFLIGSGCSLPAIQILGDIEGQIQRELDNGKENNAEAIMFGFLSQILEASYRLIEEIESEPDNIAMSNYRSLLTNISQILTERKSNILPKQATIFTTNYDLFVEKASEDFGLTLKINDGFDRSPNLKDRFSFSYGEFFNSTYSNGNLYNYQVEIPSVNLIKLHGSLSWTNIQNEIYFSINHLKALHIENRKIFSNQNGCDLEALQKLIEEFNAKFNLVRPRKEKFKDTLLNQTYYDLLRIYANELDKENSLLIAEGFSFADEHLLSITQSALRNPTLRLIIFCYDKSEVERYEGKFMQYNNVDIAFSEDKKLDFMAFNEILREVFPAAREIELDRV